MIIMRYYLVIQGHTTVPMPAPDTDRAAATIRYFVKRSGITTTDAVKTRLKPVPGVNHKYTELENLFICTSR